MALGLEVQGNRRDPPGPECVLRAHSGVRKWGRGTLELHPEEGQKLKPRHTKHTFGEVKRNRSESTADWISVDMSQLIVGNIL